jgi:hypothetical protein
MLAGNNSQLLVSRVIGQVFFRPLVRTDSVPGGDQRWASLLAFQSIAPGDYLEFTPDRIFNGDYRMHLEHK